MIDGQGEGAPARRRGRRPRTASATPEVTNGAATEVIGGELPAPPSDEPAAPGEASETETPRPRSGQRRSRRRGRREEPVAPAAEGAAEAAESLEEPVTSGVADAVAPAAEDAPPPAVDLDRPEGEPLVSGEAGEDVAIAPEMPPPPVRDGPAAAPTADDAGGEETPVSAQADTVAADHMDTAAVEEDGTAVADEGETAAEGEEPEPAAPARRRTRSARAAPEIPGSTVEVNVVVPRGLARRFDSKLIRRVVQLALEREGWKHPSTLDVTLVTDEEMREINATRRGIDEATDVLSFPMLELQPGTGLTQDFFVLPPDVSLHLGDVVISYNRVEAQAAEGGHSKERELAFLTVHAVLHILGYDHDTEPRRRQMRRREEDVLAELGLRRNGQRGGE